MNQRAPATLGDRQPTSLRCVLGITRYIKGNEFERGKETSASDPPSRRDWRDIKPMHQRLYSIAMHHLRLKGQ